MGFIMTTIVVENLSPKVDMSVVRNRRRINEKLIEGGICEVDAFRRTNKLSSKTVDGTPRVKSFRLFAFKHNRTQIFPIILSHK